ncbi:MFS transporter [Burkholderia gladioli]|uniref:MFS transporter n=1 Tax=Burkholderia gladioli TaxID=28095 RepID=UPI001C22D169|nr:MFS transporter [Burkholderia gladioli]MBU9170212.1 MFS transporter [Burkholderia gladioli]
MSPATTSSSWGELLSGRNGLRSIALAGGVALHAINIYLATTILPSVVHEIGGLEYYAWNTTLFMAASIVGAPLSTNLLARVGPRAAYLVALAVFCAGTLACAAARDMPWMLAGRVAQGFGGGILVALSYALIRIVFAPRLWSRGMGMVSGMWGIATLCGPAIGGLFAESGHWRLAFLALLPIAALLALIVIAQLPARQTQRVPAAPAALGRILLLAASVLVVSVASLSRSAAANVAGIAVGVALTLWIARLERDPRVRLLPSGAYSLRQPLGAIYACMSLLGIGVTTEIFVPYFLQTIHAQPPLLAGYLSALMAAGWSIGSLVGSGRGPRAARVLMRGGPVLVALALLALALLMPVPGLLAAGAGMAALCGALVAVGLGVGMGWPHLLTQVLTRAPAGQEDLASASLTTVQLYATAIGSALAGLVANLGGFTEPGGLAGARQAAMWLFAAFAIAPLLAAILVRRVSGAPPADAPAARVPAAATTTEDA